MEAVVQPLGVLLLIVVYFLPTLIALGRRHSQVRTLAVLNLLAGWTVIGWLALMAWALPPDGPQKAANP